MAKIAHVSAGLRATDGAEMGAFSGQKHRREKNASANFGILLAALAPPMNSSRPIRGEGQEAAGTRIMEKPEPGYAKSPGASEPSDSRIFPRREAVEDPDGGLKSNKKLQHDLRFQPMGISDEAASSGLTMRDGAADVSASAQNAPDAKKSQLKPSPPTAAQHAPLRRVGSETANINGRVSSEAAAINVNENSARSTSGSTSFRLTETTRTGAKLEFSRATALPVTTSQDEGSLFRQMPPAVSVGPARSALDSHAATARRLPDTELPSLQVADRQVRQPPLGLHFPADSPKPSALGGQSPATSAGLGAPIPIVAAAPLLAEGIKTAHVRIETDGANPALAVVHQKSEGITASLLASNARAAELAAASLPALHRSLQMIGLGSNQITAGINSDASEKRNSSSGDRNRDVPRRENHDEATVFVTAEVG